MKHPNNKKIEITCVICGIKKSFSPSHVYCPKRNYIRKCCSRECGYKYLSLNYSGEKSKAGWKNASLFVNCKNCGKEFKTYKSKIKYNRGRYCSKECTITASPMLKGGEHSYNWLGGRTKEEIRFKSKKWWKEKRKNIYIRDNYTCQICFKKCSSIQGPDKIQCDHFIPRSILVDNSIYNLWTLCNSCHTTKDGNIRHKIIRRNDLTNQEKINIIYQQYSSNFSLCLNSVF